MVAIARADEKQLDEIAPLFDAYRQFYEQAPDLEMARRYLEERLSNGDAIVFLARDDSGAAIGFTLLYPTFCSVSAARTFVLYDLFVHKKARRRGVASQLLETAQNYAKTQGAAWIKLETALTNIPGQTLYEKLGWERDNEFYTYHFQLGA